MSLDDLASQIAGDEMRRRQELERKEKNRAKKERQERLEKMRREINERFGDGTLVRGANSKS